MTSEVFQDLFVLEMTNNHRGDIDRGLEIINQFSRIVNLNKVKAAIKLQFRDVDKFVHKDFRDCNDIYYVRRVLDTKLTSEDYSILIEAIRKSGCIPMATPFDEKSVDLIEYFDLPIIKIASSSSNDWMLIKRIAKTKKPVIVSIGGLPLKDLDELVTFLGNKYIPLAINHCIASYPTEDHDLQLNQIDFLRDRYPLHTIGLSSHEYHDWFSSITASYAKGVRLFERHIDIDTDAVKIAPYSSLPHQIDAWFKAWHNVKLICGSESNTRALPIEKEVAYLNSYIRGIYAKRDIKKGDLLTEEDIYLAIPLQKRQISCREFTLGRQRYKVLRPIFKDQPIMIECIDMPYAENKAFLKLIYERGLDPNGRFEKSTKF